MHEGRKLLVQATIRKMFPAKCIDPGWGPEWEGPMFGVHVASAGQTGSLNQGDEVLVHQRAAKQGGSQLFLGLFLVVLSVAILVARSMTDL